MSIHPCEWASQKGCELKLSCPERVTLWQLARRAATKGFCWPSVVQLMFDTGLARQSVVTVVRRLADLKLIRIEKNGQKNVYHIETGNRSRSRPVDDAKPVHKKTANRSKTRPVNGAEPVQNETGTGLNLDRNRSKSTPKTGLNLDPNLKENIKTNHAHAREAVCDREPEKSGFDSDLKEEGGTPSPAPSDQPSADTTGGSEAFQGLDEAKAFMSQKLGRTVHLASPQPETVNEDTPINDPVDQERMAAQIAAMLEGLAGTRKSPDSASTGGKLSMRAYPPGHSPVRDRWEQADAFKPPLPDVTLKAEQLAAVYRAQGLHRGVA